MKDFADITNTQGAFPDVVALNDTVPGDNTGTPLVKQWVDEWFGFSQAVLDNASETPSGSPDVHDDSQILQSLQSILVDGLNGGTYSPSGVLTWNGRVNIYASAGPGTNVVGLEIIAKGNEIGLVCSGGSAGGKGIEAYGFGNGIGVEGNASGTGHGLRGYGGNSGGAGVYASGGNTDGPGGVLIGGTDEGIGCLAVGKGGSLSYTKKNQGLIAFGGDNNGDALWAITDSGSEPGTPNNDYAIWASTGGAFPATAVYGRSDLGYGLTAVTASGIGITVSATSTGCPMRIVPKSATPSTNVYEGCLYFDSDTHTLHYYDGSAWQQVAVV